MTLTPSAFARRHRVAVMAGYGGTGLKTTETYEGVQFDVNKADVPFAFAASYEFVTSDRTSLSIDHTRGLQLSPFSSGIGFTGLSWRWYYGGDVPNTPEFTDRSFMIATDRVFFIGASVGLAAGTIIRGGDAVPSTSGSGVYVGFRAGYDVQTDPGVIFRAELFSAQTTGSSGLIKSTLNALMVGAGLVYLFE